MTRRVALIVGFIFLYAPIASLIVFSFNENRLVTVWSGFSLKWYAQIFRDPQLIDATLLSLRIALWSATLALVIGTLAAFALVRIGRFRGRPLLTAGVTAPLVMPDVVIGLSLLLLFVSMDQAIGWPGARGATTIIIAHATFSAAFVTVVVQSRLSTMERDIEEAAMDLGAPHWRVVLDITLPVMAPALASAWLLAFTLSFDDLVVASFVSGPGASTLPIVIFSKVRLGVSPDVNALATLLIASVALVGLAALLLLRTRKDAHRPERA